MGRFGMKQSKGTRNAIVCAAVALAACQATVGESTPEESLGEPSNTFAEQVDTTAQALTQDFFDGFDGTSLNGSNWQNQYLWVNNELQCYDNGYNEGGGHKTLDVSGGTLKLRVVDSGVTSNCDNWDKYGNKHGNTRYKGARIASKNRKEFSRGRFTARLKMYTWLTSNTTGQASGVSGMFPAWWLLGYRNNEAPVQESNENVCWPLSGSGEIDILEHYGNNGQNGFAARGIKNLGYCNGGDWQVYQKNFSKDLNNFHEYQVDYSGSDMIYRIDNGEVGRTGGIAGNYTEPMFMILNYALNANMASGYKEYAMEVDWARHEY
jgi:beta-glucanase (GH16 family)